MEEFITEVLKELGIDIIFQSKVFRGLVSIYHCEIKTKEGKYIKFVIPFTNTCILAINKKSNMLGEIDDKNRIFLNSKEFDNYTDMLKDEENKNLEEYRKKLELYFINKTRLIGQEIASIEGVIGVKFIKESIITLNILTKDKYIDLPLIIRIGELNYINKSKYNNVDIINKINEKLGGIIVWI